MKYSDGINLTGFYMYIVPTDMPMGSRSLNVDSVDSFGWLPYKRALRTVLGISYHIQEGGEHAYILHTYLTRVTVVVLRVRLAGYDLGCFGVSLCGEKGIEWSGIRNPFSSDEFTFTQYYFLHSIFRWRCLGPCNWLNLNLRLGLIRLWGEHEPRPQIIPQPNRYIGLMNDERLGISTYLQSII
jgi:hypothetical protein